MQRFIAEDPELFIIYSRNKLTNTDLSQGSSTLGFPIRVMRNAILESGDKLVSGGHPDYFRLRLQSAEKRTD